MASPSVFLALTGALWLAGSASHAENAKAALQLEQCPRPPSHVHVGWRVFQGRCAGCHQADVVPASQGKPHVTSGP